MCKQEHIDTASSLPACLDGGLFADACVVPESSLLSLQVGQEKRRQQEEGKEVQAALLVEGKYEMFWPQSQN